MNIFNTRYLINFFGIFEKRSFDVRGLRYFFLFVVPLESCEQRKVGEGGKHGKRQLVDLGVSKN